MELLLPKDVDLAQDDDHTIIVLTRKTAMTIIRLVVGLSLALFTAQWVLALSSPTAPVLLLSIVLGGMSLWLVWTGLGYTLGKTTVLADDHGVVVSTAPLPMHPQRSVLLEQVASFSVDRKVRRKAGHNSALSKALSPGPTQQDLMGHAGLTSRFVVTWHVLAVLRDGTEVALVRSLPERRTAVVTKALLQEHLEQWRD